jgi:hypothetical protein
MLGSRSKIPSKNISLGSVTRRDLIAALKGYLLTFCVVYLNFSMARSVLCLKCHRLKVRVPLLIPQGAHELTEVCRPVDLERL